MSAKRRGTKRANPKQKKAPFYIDYNDDSPTMDAYYTMMEQSREYVKNQGADKLSDLLEFQLPLILGIVNRIIQTLKAHGSTKARRFMENNMYAYGLFPGTQVAYRSTPWGYHHGVFIGEGLVVEVGAPSCLFRLVKGMPKEQCLGMTTLKNFITDGANKKYARDIFRVKHGTAVDDDNDPAVAAEKLMRLRDLMLETGGAWNYRYLSSNCEHAACKITRDRFESDQVNDFFGYETDSTYVPFERDVRGRPGTSDGCDDACYAREATEKDCFCADEPHKTLEGWAPKFMTPGKAWCDVDTKCAAKIGRDWDYVSATGRPRFMCLRDGTLMPCGQRNHR